MTIKKQLVYGMLFVGIVMVLPIQIHSMFDDYKKFRVALGTAQHFHSDTTEIIRHHKNHLLCSRYLNNDEE